MSKWISKWWKSYKYRFVPWILFNVKRHGQIKDAPPTQRASKFHNENEAVVVPVHHLRKSQEKLITDDQLAKILTDYLAKCRPFNGWNEEMNLEDISLHNRKVMKDQFGFVVERRKSQVSRDAGTGVFVTEGVARSGSVVALYCGTLYMPSEPLFFPSLGNQYIFRCSDGIHIDGNDKWISKSIYKSCFARDRFDWDTPSCDTSWLTPHPINPLNVGQYVNNRSHSHQNNVIYQECSLAWGLPFARSPNPNHHSTVTEIWRGETGIKSFASDDILRARYCDEGRNIASLSTGGQGPLEHHFEETDHNPNFSNDSRIPSTIYFPIKYGGFIPNVWMDPSNSRASRGLRLVPLVAVRDIEEGEELLSSYFTVVHNEDPPENNAS